MLLLNKGILNYSGVWDADALALIARMTAAGETPTGARQLAINTCIVSLKANSLFSTQFDVLVITRAHGQASGLLNWIGNYCNGTAVNSPIFTTDVGYNQNAGRTACLNTNYKTASSKIVYSLNSACFGFKNSGTKTINTGHGVNSGSYTYFYGSAGYNKINSTIDYGGTEVYNIGYNNISRYSSTGIRVMLNSTSTDRSQTAGGYSSDDIYMLAINTSGISYPVATTEVLEAYWMGSNLTQAQFLTFQTIMNAYFAAF